MNPSGKVVRAGGKFWAGRQLYISLAIASVIGIVGLSAAWRWHVAGSPLGFHNDLAQAELEVAKRQSEACSARNAPGVGLRGEYFPAPDFKGKPLVSRVDTTVDFARDLEWPTALENSKPESARWSGWVRPPITGSYTLHASAPGARITISRQLVQSGTPMVNTPIELAAGRFYPVVVEIPNLAALGADGVVKFEWTAPHGMRFVIPRALLYLPSDQSTQ